MPLQDVIKINQLVRGRIDIEGFKQWYGQLATQERLGLMNCLHEFAYQAGVNDYIWADALSLAGFGNDGVIAQDIRSFHVAELGLHFSGDFYSWLENLSEDDKYTTFVILVYLFGVAEGSVFRNETITSCNHWWHRNLLDARVVEAILMDPEYYRTSMRDDAMIVRPCNPTAA
jgi:hypothetical protein